MKATNKIKVCFGLAESNLRPIVEIQDKAETTYNVHVTRSDIFNIVVNEFFKDLEANGGDMEEILKDYNIL